MAASQSVISQQYQQSIWGEMDRTLRNCFVGSAILGLLVLIAAFVVPLPPPMPLSVDDIPERIARLILEPKPAAPDIPAPERAQVAEEPKVEVPKPKIKPKPRRRTSRPVAKNKGVEGRQKAQQEVTQNLAQVTGSLDKVLDNLSKALPASETGGDKNQPPRRRRRGVRSGRTSQQLSTVQGVSDVSSPDISQSAISNEGISIAAITDLTVDESGGDPGAPAGGGGSGSGSQNDYRSNESLLSVVRRYAPGIQFCYDNELKRNPGLRGKLVVSLTVEASGAVRDVIVVQDALGSPNVVECVLSQIRGWRFPEIPHGDTSFKTPFVFTPPE